MFTTIDAVDIYNKNINILIGSGASADLFPTLALAIKDSQNKSQTIEDLATSYEEDQDIHAAVFMHYFDQCIYPVQTFDPEKVVSPKGLANLSNYEQLIKTLLGLLERRSDSNKKINLFTTNYDGCLEFSSDKIQRDGAYEFVVNDGTTGFHQKHLHTKNFNTVQIRTGVFDRTNFGIPQLNIIHLHGSVYWSKDDDLIQVSYDREVEHLLNEATLAKLRPFSKYITTRNSTTDELPDVTFTAQQRRTFWSKYKKLPVVNPTKWKFHETVFEEHYYQMLRLLSYELEKPNSVLIVFGFSFADEHILRLLQRSLSNPSLQTFICCYSSSGARKLARIFSQFRNITIIEPPLGEKLDFTNFNKFVFSLNPETYVEIEDLV
jgi:hypothetical protein